MPPKKDKKKKTINKTSMKQKQTVKQTVNINIDNKKKTRKKKNTSSDNGNPPKPKGGTLSSQMSYYRQINAMPPMVIQNVPNNNELIGAIQGILNKTQAPIPTQVDNELLKQTMTNMDKLNESLSKSKSKPDPEPDPALELYLKRISKPRSKPPPSPSPIASPIATPIATPRPISQSRKSKSEPLPSPSFLSNPQNLASSPKNPKDPLYKQDGNKFLILNPKTNRWINAYGQQAKKLGIGMKKP